MKPTGDWIFDREWDHIEEWSCRLVCACGEESGYDDSSRKEFLTEHSHHRSLRIDKHSSWQEYPNGDCDLFVIVGGGGSRSLEKGATRFRLRLSGSYTQKEFADKLKDLSDQLRAGCGPNIRHGLEIFEDVGNQIGR